MVNYGTQILISTLLGTIARMFTLRVDYRQYPSYPHAYTTHFTLGFIAASLGALVLPALLEQNYTAVTFLALAAQQFRGIRDMERKSLSEIEENELVKRGKAYIEGIAKLFEARNYLSLLTSLMASLVIHYLSVIPGIIAGLLFILLFSRMMFGPRIRDIADIEKAEMLFQGKNVGVGPLLMTNIGEEAALQNWKKHGLALVIKPKNEDARATLANLGQRQAILHDAATILGSRLDEDVQHYLPMARLNLDTGEVYVMILPIEPDLQALIEAVKRVPVLESAQRKPLQSKAGKMAAD